MPLHEWKETFEFNYNTGLYDLGTEHSPTTWIFEAGSFVPCGKITNDKHYSIITDHLGTLIEAYNQEGEQIWEREQDLYGNSRQGFAKENFRYPFKYQGQYYDSEVELCYNRFRYYHPETGRYISEDPIGFDSGIYNFYKYVSDSNSIVDIFGLDWNYVLVNSSGEVYYHGRAADGQTMQDIARRHANTVGDDGARFGDGDTLFVKTPPKTPRNTVRGIEQRGIEEKKILGKNNVNVRGNKINGISEQKQKKKKGKQRLRDADKFLKENNVKKVSQLPNLDSLTFNEYMR